MSKIQKIAFVYSANGGYTHAVYCVRTNIIYKLSRRIFYGENIVSKNESRRRETNNVILLAARAVAGSENN